MLCNTVITSSQLQDVFGGKSRTCGFRSSLGVLVHRICSTRPQNLCPGFQLPSYEWVLFHPNSTHTFVDHGYLKRTLNQLFFSMHIIKEQTTSSISNTMSNILVLIFLQYFKIKKISKWSYMKLYINLCFFSTGANFCLFSKISTF